MLRLRSCIASRLLSCPSEDPISPLHRLLSAAAAAPAVSPSPTSFAVEDYLVAACGLTRAQALKASTKLSHLKSPSKPDAVLAFLSDLDLSGTDVTALVVKDPLFLCASVDGVLSRNVVGLTDLGLSRPEIARLISLAPFNVRLRSLVSKLPYYLHLFGSYNNLLRALKQGSRSFGCDLEKVVKPNVAFLQECGLDACGIASLCVARPRILGTNPEHVRAMAERAQALGVPRSSGMFRLALRAVACCSGEKIAVKVEHLKSTFRWSDAEVGIAVCKFPMVLGLSKDILQRKSEFLISVVGLEPAYILRQPVMLGYSLEGRLRPRYYVLKFLKENGLLDRDQDYGSAIKRTDEAFMEKFICPHKEAAPYLTQDYAAACRGEMVTRFGFT